MKNLDEFIELFNCLFLSLKINQPNQNFIS